MRERQRRRLTSLNALDRVASLNWTVVRALEAFVAGKCIEFRGESNGNTPRPLKPQKNIKKVSKQLQKYKNTVFYRIVL